VVDWARAVRPRVICLENVEEFKTWGPLTEDDMPCPKRKGETFNEWKGQLEALGYVVEHRELRACDYGTPTIAQAPVPGRALRRRADRLAAAHARRRPEAVAHGSRVHRLVDPVPVDLRARAPAGRGHAAAHRPRRHAYVVHAARPFIVPVTHPATRACSRSTSRCGPSPARIAASLRWPCPRSSRPATASGRAKRRAFPADKPLGDSVDGQKHGCPAFLAKHYGGTSRRARRPTSRSHTITTQDHHHEGGRAHHEVQRGQCRQRR
jgi:DNA (cytosine-5)-methyltransferase 1